MSRGTSPSTSRTDRRSAPSVRRPSSRAARHATRGSLRPSRSNARSAAPRSGRTTCSAGRSGVQVASGGCDRLREGELEPLLRGAEASSGRRACRADAVGAPERPLPRTTVRSFCFAPARTFPRHVIVPCGRYAVSVRAATVDVTYTSRQWLRPRTAAFGGRPGPSRRMSLPKIASPFDAPFGSRSASSHQARLTLLEPGCRSVRTSSRRSARSGSR
jgi:hypothetical protein